MYAFVTEDKGYKFLEENEDWIECEPKRKEYIQTNRERLLNGLLGEWSRHFRGGLRTKYKKRFLTKFASRCKIASDDIIFLCSSELLLTTKVLQYLLPV